MNDALRATLGVAFALFTGALGFMSGCDRLRGNNGDLVATLPNDSYAPECATIDETHVYWTASGHVFRAPRAGGAVEDFAVTAGRPKAIAALGNDVLFVDETTSILYAKSKTGGDVRQVTKLSGVPSAWCMVEDEAAIYAGGQPLRKYENGSLYFEPDGVAVRIDKVTGKTTELLREKDADFAIAIDDTHVYVQSGKHRYDVRRVPKTGGPIQSLNARDPRLDPSSGTAPFELGPMRDTLAVSGGKVYAHGGDRVFVLPVSGGVPSPLAVRPPMISRTSLVPAKNGVCIAAVFELECIDANGRSTKLGRNRSIHWMGVRGDDAFWFAHAGDIELRRAKL